eukprot:6477722-Amphidinium_carterae.1
MYRAPWDTPLRQMTCYDGTLRALLCPSLLRYVISQKCSQPATCDKTTVQLIPNTFDCYINARLGGVLLQPGHLISIQPISQNPSRLHTGSMS